MPLASATSTWVALAAIVLVAFATEAALGFGAMVISVALAAQLVPLDRLLPVMVPLNLCLSIYLAARYAPAIDRRFLARRVLPPVALGFPLGLYAFARLPGPTLVRVFGGFVVVLASLELVRALRRREAARLGAAAGVVLLFVGGVVHGAFSTGGPFVVYVTGREIDDKHVFRATLSALWVLLGAALCVSYAVAGGIGVESMSATAALALPAVAGLLVGEWAHARVQAGTFRVALFVMLLVAGALLAVR